MKNSQLVIKYLNECAEQQRLKHSDKIEDLELYGEMIKDGQTERLHDACIANGWTLAELDAAYGKRFGLSKEEIARLRGK